MRHRLFRAAAWVLVGFGLPVSWSAHSCGALAAEVTSADLLAAEADPNDWLTNGRSFSNLRFSPLTEINTANVQHLAPKWIYQTGKAATFQATPLVSDGVIYLSEPFSSVSAIDARTGEKIWRYEHKLPAQKLCCGPANRGVALGEGKVFVATVDARLITLDAKSGEIVWNVLLAAPDASTAEDKAALADIAGAGSRAASGQSGVGANSAPLYYDGKVFIGVTGAGYGLHLESERPGAPLGTVVGLAGKYGRSGFLAAFDAATGQRIWQFDSTQAGWEGDFVEKTAYGAALPRDIAREKADMAQFPDAWRTGGGTVWHTPALDPALGLLYFGIGNPSPQATGDGRPGDNLYTVSLVAVDVETGKLRWHFQQAPHDLWGYDVASPPSLFDVEIGGKIIPAVGQASKLGWYFVNDRRDGKFLYKSDAFVPQDNLFTAPTPEGVTIAPGVGGGVNWSPAAVDAAKGIAYVAAMHLPTTFKTAILPAHDGKPPVAYTTADPANVPNWGVLAALDLKQNGKILWSHQTPQPLVGGALATAGGLVFTGEGNGFFDAFDAASGALLWRFNCGAGVNAPPISYAIGGRQYIAVAAGGSAIWGYPQGDALLVFALPQGLPVKGE
ncbi:pyrroloquinoline quinone-dependent dehydrogenase [Methylocella silvestris]|uniref:Pyrrolo-quinoline quinone n=1 Tax=Methylocella silvestris TaxID=199596 RepID=A0A2J7TI12_METSI|nr:PQQ-binding-like beta-propeller repeat protein [Methylocella silvestris]PNG26413.1 pyrrolo-quinoline quinone [Methylocella silvestris]